MKAKIDERGEMLLESKNRGESWIGVLFKEVIRRT